MRPKNSMFLVINPSGKWCDEADCLPVFAKSVDSNTKYVGRVTTACIWAFINRVKRDVVILREVNKYNYINKQECISKNKTKVHRHV